MFSSFILYTCSLYNIKHCEYCYMNEHHWIFIGRVITRIISNALKCVIENKLVEFIKNCIIIDNSLNIVSQLSWTILEDIPIFFEKYISCIEKLHFHSSWMTFWHKSILIIWYFRWYRRFPMDSLTDKSQ